MPPGGWDVHLEGKPGQWARFRFRRQPMEKSGFLSTLVAAVLVASLSPPAPAQIFDRLKERAEEALGEASVLQRLLEKAPGVTTSIHDAHTEVPFLDSHNPTASALLTVLPRTAENAFYAPPGPRR